MNLTTVKKANTGRKTRKRIGRGAGSGQGCTAGKGNKGQQARSGYSKRLGFEGGQTPLFMRVPTRGFKNARFKTEYIGVNVSQLDKWFPEGGAVDAQSLKAKGMYTSKKDGIKLLGAGDVKGKFEVTVQAASKSAIEKIEKAGGKVTLDPKGYGRIKDTKDA